MSRGPRNAHRKDGNHDAVVDALRKCGAKVLDLHELGGGCADLFCTVGERFTFVEVKSGKRQLEPAQEDFAKDWPVRVIRSAEQAAEMVAAFRLENAITSLRNR